MAFPTDFDDVSTGTIITASRNNAITKKLGLTTIATSATTGHFSMPTSAGIPSGDPANGIGSMVYDSTNDQLFINEDASAGSWERIGVTYEDGTWTPTIVQSGGGGFDATYDTQVADYVRIGDMVHASCLIILTGSDSGGSGTVSIAGLPFSQNQHDYQQVALIGYNDVFATIVVRAYHTGTTMVIINPGVTQGNYSGTVGAGYLAMTTTYSTSS